MTEGVVERIRAANKRVLDNGLKPLKIVLGRSDLIELKLAVERNEPHANFAVWPDGQTFLGGPIESGALSGIHCAGTADTVPF